MKILLTGVAGFIGSHAAQRLLAMGHQVVALDNFDPFYARSIKQDNLLQVSGEKNFTFAELDLCDRTGLELLFAEHGPFDAVVHLAAKAGVRPSIEDPLGYERANLAGTLCLLELAAKAKPVPKFIFASSSSVYGNNSSVPFGEDDPVDHPISPYAATKKAGELICHSYHHLYNLPVFCLRFFTVYGPRQRPDLAIHKFARKILRGEAIEVFGDGSTSRDYTFIDDIVTGIVRSVERCSGYEIINLGSDSPITLSDMLQTVANACGKEPVIQRLPMQPGDVERTYADITKAKRLLDYSPSTRFQQGVKVFVEWLKLHMD